MFFKKLFSNNNKIKSKVAGEIKYLNLQDWWLNELTEEERNLIRNRDRYVSFPEKENFIDEGDVLSSSITKVKQFQFFVSMLVPEEEYEIGETLINKGESYIDEKSYVLDNHFFYLSAIKFYYSVRETKRGALDKAIEYCKKQINISQKAKEEFLKDEWSVLPNHTGYKQLAIIYEKQKQYEKALEITKQALLQGWNEDSERRIARLEKKIQSLSKK